MLRVFPQPAKKTGALGTEGICFQVKGPHSLLLVPFDFVPSFLCARFRRNGIANRGRPMEFRDSTRSSDPPLSSLFNFTQLLWDRQVRRLENILGLSMDAADPRESQR
jgi:hypothetical protein